MEYTGNERFLKFGFQVWVKKEPVFITNN